MISDEAFPWSRWLSLFWALRGMYGAGLLPPATRAPIAVQCHQSEVSCLSCCPHTSLGLLMGPCKVLEDLEDKANRGLILLQAGERAFAKSNRDQHLVLELSAAPQQLVEGGKAKAGQRPSTWHC